MKISILTLLFCAFGFAMNAQAPERFQYQTVVRDISGQLLVNQSVSFRISIHQGSAGGSVAYSETHTLSTNDFGLANLEIGGGSAVSGSMSAIEWSGDLHFLEIELDAAGGSNYTSMGTSQLLSVPYALSSGDKVWSKSGSNTYYTSGRVGIGVSSPANLLDVSDTSGVPRLVSLGSYNASSSNDVLEINVQGTAPDNAQFIEMERGSTIEARINADGSAEFGSVTVEEELNSSTSPIKGKVYANGLPIAYGYVSSSTTSASLITDYGVASVTKTASTTGEYRITLNKTIVGSPVIIVTSYNASPGDEIATANGVSSTEIEVNIADGSGTAINSNFYFVVFGSVQ